MMMTIRHIDSNPTGFVLRKRTGELIPPTTLFSGNLQSYSGFLLKLRNFFNANEASLPIRSSRTIVNQLSYGLYSEAVEQDVKSELAKVFLSRGICHKPTPDTSDGTSNIIENGPHKFTESP